MSSPPIYTCPIHHVRLTRRNDEAHCPGCPAPYRIENDIWMLDPVQRTDRTAFDKQVETAPAPLDLTKAGAYLDRLGLEKLADGCVLDIGCGLGDLTCGLAVSEKLINCEIYAVDHSLASVRRAAASVRVEHGNRAHFSAQDASRLFFPDSRFDLIFASALLHHILDYPGLLRDILRLLRPGGRAVLSEPFLEGYFWPAFLLRTAVFDLKITNIEKRQYSLCNAILDNIGIRTREADNPSALNQLTDKHFFQVEGILSTAQELGYRKVAFADYDDPSFYENWMAHFLDVYGIIDTKLRNRALELYSQLREYAGPRLPKLISHFKLIVLEK